MFTNHSFVDYAISKCFICTLVFDFLHVDFVIILLNSFVRSKPIKFFKI